jgi:hypothetical protein
MYNLQRAVVRAWVSEFGEASLKDGPPPGPRTSSLGELSTAKRAAKAMRRNHVAKMAARGAKFLASTKPPPPAHWAAASEDEARRIREADR